MGSKIIELHKISKKFKDAQKAKVQADNSAKVAQTASAKSDSTANAAQRAARRAYANDLAYKSQIALKDGDRTSAYRLAEFAHRFDRRANKLDVATPAHFRKVFVFREKSVPRVNGLHIANLGSTDDVFNQQIALCRSGWSNAISLISHAQIIGTTIRFAEHSDRFNAHFAAGTQDTQGNLATICHQDSLKHCVASY